MCVKGKETEWTLSSLVKEIKLHSCSTEIHTKMSFCLPEGKIWPRIPACWWTLLWAVVSAAHVCTGGTSLQKTVQSCTAHQSHTSNADTSLSLKATGSFPTSRKNGWHCIQWFRNLRCTRQDFLVQMVSQRMNRNSFETFLQPPNQKAWLCIANWNYHKKRKVVLV